MHGRVGLGILALIASPIATAQATALAAATVSVVAGEVGKVVILPVMASGHGSFQPPEPDLAVHAATARRLNDLKSCNCLVRRGGIALIDSCGAANTTMYVQIAMGD